MFEPLLYSTLSGLSTVLGGFLALIVKKPSRRFISLMLGFAAGVMLGVAVFDLIPEALEITSITGTALGFAFGLFFLMVLDHFLPHLHKRHVKGAGSNDYLKLGYFVAMGIALHNLPEGLAIGAGYEATPHLGGVIALAIALHNIPEGLCMSVPLKAGGASARTILGICFLAGIFTPIGTLIGSLIFGIGGAVVGMSLAFAAGAMIYIVSDELIPESHAEHSHTANFGLAAGFIIVLLLG